MSPVDGVDGNARPAAQDVTARARIRDTAIAQFATHGMAAATLRVIADAAGVSVGLVQHHFGTKDGLRQACDAAVIDRMRQRLDVVETIESASTQPNFAALLYGLSVDEVRYVIRLLTDDGPNSAWLFDEIAASTEQFLTTARPDLFPPRSSRARDGATAMSVMHLGAAVLSSQVERRTGVSPHDPATAPKIGLVMLDVYIAMADWIGSAAGQRTKAAVEQYVEDLAPTAQQEEPRHA